MFALSVYLGMWQCSTCDRNQIFYFLLRGGGVLEDRSIADVAFFVFVFVFLLPFRIGMHLWGVFCLVLVYVWYAAQEVPVSYIIS